MWANSGRCRDPLLCLSKFQYAVETLSFTRTAKALDARCLLQEGEGSCAGCRRGSRSEFRHEQNDFLQSEESALEKAVRRVFRFCWKREKRLYRLIYHEQSNEFRFRNARTDRSRRFLYGTLFGSKLICFTNVFISILWFLSFHAFLLA